MKLKLSNFLNNTDLFLNQCYEKTSKELSFVDTELISVLINTKNNESKIKLLNYVLDNFLEFEMIFSYKENEFNVISNSLKINKSIIFDKLNNDYNLEDENNGLGNYTEWEIQRINDNIQESQKSTELSLLNKKLIHLKNDYLENINNQTRIKFKNTCWGFAQYLSDIYKFSLGLTLQISKLIYGNDQTYIMQNHRIKKVQTIEDLTIFVDKMLQRKLEILNNPDNDKLN